MLRTLLRLAGPSLLALSWAMPAGSSPHTVGTSQDPLDAFERSALRDTWRVGDLLAQRVLDPDEKKPDPENPEIDLGLDPGKAEPKRLKHKKPGLAMALSALLPGAGQFYIDSSNLLAFAYVGIEGLAWYLKFAWESDGDEKTDEFERFAWTGEVDPVNGAPRNDVIRDEGHWSWDRWRASFSEQPEGCLHPTNIDYLQTDSTLVTFWFTNRREFFEDIGKYDKYDCGWFRAEDRALYRDMRDETNKILERARLMSQVVLLNHITSAIHAFFQARSHNNRVEVLNSELNFGFIPEYDAGGIRAQLALRRRF